ncbi:MAG: Gfo/Idh/MocA family oxidoreductase [Eubacteriales bacterium]|nr:Gfo/Idh/MocA family oxidoreductase [Eubacteriales bacterium]
MQNPIRFATIGTGKIVRKFLEAAAQCPELSHEALYSRSRENAEAFIASCPDASRRAVRTYTDLNAMAQDPSIDAVYLASPNAFHCEQAILMMRGGKHVLCEKPIASNSRELALMIETAREHRVVLMEAMRSAYAPGYSLLRAHLSDLGTIRRATFQYCQYSSRYDRYKQGIIENAFRPELSNGALMDIGVYCVYPLVSLFGIPDRIAAQSVFLENGVDGAGTILASYPQMQAELIYSKITDSSLPSQIQGENANLILREIADMQELTICRRGGEREVISIDRGSNDMTYECEEWVRRIRNGILSLSDSVKTMQVMDEARRQAGIVFPADGKNNA